MVDRVGQRLGNYQLLRLLGQGGFADVYLAEHVHLRTRAAIKVLQLRLGGNNVQSFLKEARTIAHLVHPYIIRVLDFGVQDDTPFLVMDYAPRGTFRQRFLQGKPLPPASLYPYIKQAANALQYAHDKKLIHRDVKPENMLIGPNEEVLLSDFGFALMQSSTSQTNDAAGTAAYMAPEQIQGKPRPASDQYALGIIAYEWLTGNCPFKGTFFEIATQHMLVPPAPIHGKAPDVSPELEQVVMTALAKDPDRRYRSVRHFASALERACLANKDVSIIQSQERSNLEARGASISFPSPENKAGVEKSPVIITKPAMPATPAIQDPQKALVKFRPVPSLGGEIQAALPERSPLKPVPTDLIREVGEKRQPASPFQAASLVPEQLSPGRPRSVTGRLAHDLAAAPRVPHMPSELSPHHNGALQPPRPRPPQSGPLTPPRTRAVGDQPMVGNGKATVPNLQALRKIEPEPEKPPSKPPAPAPTTAEDEQPVSSLEVLRKHKAKVAEHPSWSGLERPKMSSLMQVVLTLVTLIVILGTMIGIFYWATHRDNGQTVNGTPVSVLTQQASNNLATATARAQVQATTNSVATITTQQNANPYQIDMQQLVLSDALSDNGPLQWQEFSATRNCEFAGGKYHARASSGTAWMCYALGKTYQNFTYQINLSFEQASDGSSGGLVFRADEDTRQSYVFKLFADGRFALVKCNGAISQCDMMASGARPLETFKVGQTNTIAVVALNNVFTLFLNGEPVTDPWTDNGNTYQSGLIGVFVQSGQDPATTDVAYSNLKIWE